MGNKNISRLYELVSELKNYLDDNFDDIVSEIASKVNCEEDTYPDLRRDMEDWKDVIDEFEHGLSEIKD